MIESTGTDLTKQYIVDALFQLLSKKPYDKITIVDIVNRAGIGRATFYRHFNNKNDIILSCFNKEMDTFKELIHYTAKNNDDYYELFFTIFTKIKEKKRLMKLIIQLHLEHFYLQFLNDALIENFKVNHLDLGDYAPYYYAGCFFNVSIKWLENDCQDSIKSITDTFYNYTFAILAQNYIKQ